jgi:hypothetical protein
LVKVAFDFRLTVLNLVDSHEKEVDCWMEISTVSEETVKTSNATQTPKASAISASRSW